METGLLSFSTDVCRSLLHRAVVCFRTYDFRRLAAGKWWLVGNKKSFPISKKAIDEFATKMFALGQLSTTTQVDKVAFLTGDPPAAMQKDMDDICQKQGSLYKCLIDTARLFSGAAQMGANKVKERNARDL